MALAIWRARPVRAFQPRPRPGPGVKSADWQLVFRVMRVFISWSGERSRAVAHALRDWLPQVINNIEPFVSSLDISAGARWQADIAEQLSSTHFGLICVTRANQDAPWLNFEAGALAKSLDVASVVPLAIDLKPSDVRLPLGQFQAQEASEEGIRAIARSINAANEFPLVDAVLDRALDKWWPDIEAALQDARSRHDETTTTVERSDRELLEEVLDTVRDLASPRTHFSSRNLVPMPHEGTRIAHRAFGQGVVTGIEPGGIARIAFDADGSTRRLMWEYAPVTVVDNVG